MNFRALGPLTVEVDGRLLKLGGPRQRMVLAVLLSRANHTVSQDALIEAVWGESPPDAAKATLQSYVYGLRRELGSAAIARHGDGYRVDVDADVFDVLAFEQLVERGHRLLGTDPFAARSALADALDLWFGHPYGGLDASPVVAAEVARLDALRLVAVEARIEADLANGNHAGIVGELETLVREHPLRERFRAQQMLALYRGGRQAEALRAYQQARTQLAEELGIEPSIELKELEQQILEQAPVLRSDARTAIEASDRLGPPIFSDGVVRTVRGYELREPLGRGDFGVVYRAYQPSVGREVAVKVIHPEYANHLTFVRRFEREAQIVANLEHPHIVPLFDFWRDPDGAFLVMPIMRGGSLADALRRGGWNLAPALQLLDQVGGALAYAHRRGVFHRDVKPGNVLLDEEGNAYVSDFGIAAHRTDASDVPVTSSLPFVPPEALRGEQHTSRSDVFSFGVLTFHLLTGVVPARRLPLPPLDQARPGLPAELVKAVARAVAEDPGDRFERVDDYLRAVRQAVGADVVAVASAGVVSTSEPVRNPYKGLRAFGEADAIDFHGRAALADELLRAVASHNLVAVVGPSGSGKSSVVRAGLLPALRAGGITGSRHWLLTDMFPGSHPFEELEAALLRVAVDRPSGLLTDLLTPNGLLRVSKQILPGDESTLVILIDQFEELFSSVRSEVTRRLFLDNLTMVAGDERSRVRVVLTMRADFFNRPLEYGEFAHVFGKGMVTVGMPTRDGLAQAIAAPARRVGVDLEPGLVGRVIADVENQPGGLPLLQYALTEMFPRREGDTLTIAGYERTGGVLGALGRRAEELYAGLTGSGQEAARQLFLRLVTVDEASSDTRRRARQSELKSLDLDQETLDTVVRTFGAFRLLSFDRDPVTRGPTVEVAHEALLREWSRLRGWIEDERESLILARRLNLAAQDWINAARDPSFLLRGARLEQAAQWKETAAVALTVEEVEYLHASAEQQAADMAAARRRRHRLIILLSVGLVVVTTLALVAYIQRGVAEREARDARVRQLAGESLIALDEDPELAILVALEAVGISRASDAPALPEAIGALQQAMHTSRLMERWEAGTPGAGGHIQILSAAPSGDWLVTNGLTSSDLLMISVADGSRRVLKGPDQGLHTFDIAIGPDGRHVAVSYTGADGAITVPASDVHPDVAIFETATGEEVQRLAVGGGAFALDFDPDGDRLAIVSVSHMSIWDWSEGVEEVRLSAAVDEHTTPESLAFLAGGETIVAPIQGVGLVFFDVSTGAQVDVVPAPDVGQLISADPSRTRVAYLSGDRLHIYDAASPEPVRDIAEAAPLVMAWSPSGSLLAHAGFDPTVVVVDSETGRVLARLSGSRDNVFGLTFLDEGRVANAAGNEVLVWDVSPKGPADLEPIRPHTGPQWGYAMSEDGLQLGIFTSLGENFELIDASSGDLIAYIPNQLGSADVGIRTVSPDFTLVGALDSLDRRTTVRRLPSLEVVYEFDPCRNPLTFSPDSSLVLVSGSLCIEGAASASPAVSQVIEIGSGNVILDIPHRMIYSAGFNPPGVHEAGRYLALTDFNVVEVYDVAEARLIAELASTDVPGVFLNLAFDRQGRYLVGGTASGRVWAVDMEAVVEGESMADSLVFDRQAHTGAAPVPAITSEGIVGSVSFDGLVRVWDLHLDTLLVEFRADVDTPVVVFAPDGSYLMYPHGGNILRFYLDPERLVAIAEDRLTRDFTAEECRRYRDPDTCPDPP